MIRIEAFEVHLWMKKVGISLLKEARLAHPAEYIGGLCIDDRLGSDKMDADPLYRSLIHLNCALPHQSIRTPTCSAIIIVVIIFVWLYNYIIDIF